jgi:ferredoxin-type protein NapG
MAGGSRRGFFAWLGQALGSQTIGVPTDAEPDPAPDPDDLPEFVPPPTESPAPASQAAPPRVVELRINPPGAVANFADFCSRCGKCIEACPEDAIHKGSDGLPTLSPARNPCQLCPVVPCAAACPDGALRPIPREAVRIAIAVPSPRLCLNTHHAESCSHCFDQCPIDGVMAAGPRGIPHIDPATCTGCGLCARSCRATPQAIFIRPIPADG